MAWSLSELEEITKAYKQGVLRVRYADREVIYRSREEMKAIINEAEHELGIKKKGPFRATLSYSKGLKGGYK